MVGGIASAGSFGSPYGLSSLRGGTVARGGGSKPDETKSGDAAGGSGQTLTPEQQQQVAKLKQIDASVRQHEAAHQAAGGAHAGGASFTYTRGPDGKNYATAGEVPIDISREADPSATIAKMEQVKAAALSPADPSAQDSRVAAQADALKMQAQQELRQKGGSGTSGESPAPAQTARGIAAYGAAQGIGSRSSQGLGLSV